MEFSIRNRGFSAAELVVVMTVMLIAVAVALPLYTNFYLSTQLDETKVMLIQKLRTAHDRAESGSGNRSYGVYLQLDFSGTQDRYILYQNSSGTTYTGRSAADIAADTVTVIDPLIQMTRPSGSVDINFAKGSGVPSAVGQIILKHQTEGARIIDISALGFVREL